MVSPLRSVDPFTEGCVVKASREFQIFAKPAGATCNLDCRYCYYLHKDLLYPDSESFRMSDDLLEEYIRQQIAITPEPVDQFLLARRRADRARD